MSLKCIDNKLYVCRPHKLLEFDGVTWKTYDIQKGYVRDVVSDGKGLWLATTEGVVSIRESIIQYEIPNTCFVGFFDGQVVEDLDGAIWTGMHSSNGNLCKKTGDVWQEVIGQNYLASNNYTHIAVDSNNVVWAINPDVLYRINGDTVTQFNQYNSVLQGYYSGLTVDSHNNKWISTSHAMVKYNDTVWTVYDVSEYPWVGFATAISADKSGNMLMGRVDNGLVKFNGSETTLYDNAFFGSQNSQIRMIVVDKNNDVWLDYEGSSLSRRLCRLHNDSLEWFADNINLPSLSGGLKAVDKEGNLWIESSEGLMKYDWNEWTLYNSTNTRLLNDQVHGFLIDRNNNKWVGSSCYMAKFNEDDLIISLPEVPSAKQGPVFTIFPNPNASQSLHVNVGVNMGRVGMHGSGRSGDVIEVSITDMPGRLQLKKQLQANEIYSGGSFAIDISGLRGGVYLIEFRGPGVREVHKMVKM